MFQGWILKRVMDNECIQNTLIWMKHLGKSKVHACVAFCTTNTVYDFSKPKMHNTRNVYKKWYSRTILFWMPMFTCRTNWLQPRTEISRTHARHIKHNNPQSPHALHILQNLQEYAPLHNTTTLLHHANKDSNINSCEEFLYLVV